MKKLTTEEFIDKAKLVHGDLYDYSKSVYNGDYKPIIITCRIHGDFSTIPKNHLKGCICRGCANKLKAEEKSKNAGLKFIKEAIDVHGSRYDYSKVVYKNSHTKVCVICPIHGEFWVSKSNHISREVGCPECTKESKRAMYVSNTDEFVKKAKLLYGNDLYEYSLVDYVDSKTKVKIICKKHGIFEQTPNAHLRGSACLKCGIERTTKKSTLNLEDFIKKSNEIHGLGTYDYSKVNYINNRVKVEIICPKHGVFFQKPNSHMDGKGCPKCGLESRSEKRRMGKSEFIRHSNLIHGLDKYNYSFVKYKNSNTKVLIKCNTCGRLFEQTAGSHMAGVGCPSCSFSKGEKQVEDLLKYNSISYDSQKKFIGCKDKNMLSFDFYLPGYNLVIEYDGLQHYQSVDFFGGENGFKATQRRDKIKNEYCYYNDIIICRIVYGEDIYKELSKYIKLKEIEHG